MLLLCLNKVLGIIHVVDWLATLVAAASDGNAAVVARVSNGTDSLNLWGLLSGDTSEGSGGGGVATVAPSTVRTSFVYNIEPASDGSGAIKTGAVRCLGRYK